MRSSSALTAFCAAALIAILLGCGSASSSPRDQGSNSGGETSAALSVSAVSPAVVPAASATTVTVTGTGFTTSTTVQVNGTTLATTYVSSTQVTASIAAGQFSSAGVIAVTVSDKGITTSGTVSLEIDNPQPTITGLDPVSALAGTGALDATIAGSGFVNDTVLLVNGVARQATYTSATRMTVTLNPADLAAAGSLSLTALNRSPGGGVSTAVSFAVVNPIPGLISVSPATVDGGGTAELPILLSGTNFVASSVVQIGGTSRATTYVSSTQLRASLTTADQASARTLPVVVVTPAPGGGTSAPSAVKINANPQPVLSSLSPSSLVAGTPVTLRVVGSGFLLSSTVLFNGSPLATQFVSTTELTSTIDASRTAIAGTATIIVKNPPPVGGQSAPSTLSIDSPAPTLSSVSPAIIFRSSASTVVTLQGTGFQPTSTALWNGNPYATTFVSSNQVSLSVLQKDVPATSTATVQVTTPVPGGGSSATLSLPVYSVKPTITAVRETVTGNLCQQINLSVTGQNLPTSGLMVKLNGTALTTVSSAGNMFLLATVPPGLGVVPNPQLTVAYTPLDGDVSDPFTLLPATAVCFTPSAIVSYPGTTFGINASATVLGSNTQPVISTLALPSGFSAVTATPYSLPSRFYVTTDPSVAASTYSIGIQVAGSSTTQVVLPVSVVSSTPSFSFANPVTSELAVRVGGTSTFTVQSSTNSASSGTPDFRITLAAAGLPSGVTASFQPAKVVPGDTATVTLMADSKAPIRQNVPISVSGTVDGSTVSATVAYSLNVTPAPGTIANNRTAFTPTGATPFSIAYDRSHDLVFASNPVWNRIDVLSNSTHALVRSIPLPSPTMIDLSQDSGTLWIGTRSQQVFALDTTAFTLTKYAVPSVAFFSNLPPSAWIDSELYALSNGSLLLAVNDAQNGTQLGSIVWSPTTGVATVVSMGDGLMRSRDGSKVFGLDSGFSGCKLDVYSVAQAAVTVYTIDSGFTGSSYCGAFEASNSDGSVLVTNLNTASLRGIQWISGTGQSLGSFTAALAPGILSTVESVLFFPHSFVFSDDGLRLYQVGSKTGRGNLVATYDVASRALLGLAPAIASSTPPLSSGFGGNTSLAGADAKGMLIGIQSYGVAFEDSTYFQDYGTASTAISGGNPSSFSPLSGPLSGGTSFTPNVYGSLQPDVWFGDVRGTTALSGGTLTITSPAGVAPGPVDLKLIYPNGELGYKEQGFSYGPSPQNMVYSGSSPAGGGQSAVTGFGLPGDSSSGSVSIGGTSATITTTPGQYPPWTGEAVPSTFLTFTLPSGRPGYADLKVTTPSGDGTLPRAVFYATSVTDYSFSGTASAVIYDKYGKRAYVLVKDSVLVFAADANGFQAPIPVPTVHNIFDLRDGALSIDGNYLLVGNAGDGSVAVLNLAAPASSYALAIPDLSSSYAGCTTGPGSIAALSGGKAFVLPVGSTSQCGYVTKAATIDIQARSATILGSCGTYFNAQAQGSTDGTQIAIKTGSSGSTCFYSPGRGFNSSGSLTAYLTAAISGDGNLLAGDLSLFDAAGKPLGKLAQPPALYGNPLTSAYPVNARTVQLRGSHLNAAGGLYYVPHVGYFEIIDGLNDTLRMRFSLSQTVQDVPEPLAIDEGGRQVFLLTDAGLTVVDMGEAPLAVGHLGGSQPVSGGLIQVRGSGFDTSTIVTVDSAHASATVVDENTLNVVLPLLASGPHNVTLSRGDGSTLTVRTLIVIP